MSKLSVAIVLPSYNEASCIALSLDKINNYLKNNGNYNFNIVVVNDGSKDDTANIVENNFPNVHLVSYFANKGKGGAVKEGLKYCLENINSDYIIYMDVDLSTDLKAVDESLLLLDKGHHFVIGSRYDKESKILLKQPLKRRIISKLSRIIISLMFNFKLKDTQCGFKAMRKEVASLLTNKTKINDYSFDVEYLYISQLNGVKFKSLPVIWKDDRESKVYPFRSSIKFFLHLFKIKRNKKYYKPSKESNS